MEYDRLRVILRCSMLSAGGANRFIVHGEPGSLLKRLPDQQEELLRAGARPGSTNWGRDPDPILFYENDLPCVEVATPSSDQSEFYRAVTDAIHGKAQNPLPPVDAIAVMAIIEAATKSAVEGRAISLS